LKVERKKISCKDTEVIKKYPACLKDEKKISSSVENAQPPHQKSNGPALNILYFCTSFLHAPVEISFG
jgi:hypothetical protein